MGHNLPILDSIIKDTDTRALYLFPTKALAQDHLNELYQTIEALGEESRASYVRIGRGAPSGDSIARD